MLETEEGRKQLTYIHYEAAGQAALIEAEIRDGDEESIRLIGHYHPWNDVTYLITIESPEYE